MADLNYEQFMTESPLAALKAQLAAIEDTTIVIPKVDHVDKYVMYLMDTWND